MKPEGNDSPSFRYVADKLGHADFTLVLSAKGTSIHAWGAEKMREYVKRLATVGGLAVPRDTGTKS